jgi:tetratricopeptide (TPR) repeat protein
MRYRRLATRLLIVAAVVCCASLAYFAYGKYRISSLTAACDEARRAKQWPELERLSRQWIEWEQDKAQPWLYAAEAASAQGENIRTASYLYYLPNDDPRTPVALLELSHMQFGILNQPIAAAQTCERILSIQPDNAEAHRRLIFYYAMSRQRARMIEEARRAIQLGCDTPETYLYLIGADWITFTNGYEVNQRWLQSAPTSEIFQVAAAMHWVRSSALDESVETPNPDGTSRSEQFMNEMFVRFPKNLEVLAFQLDLASFRGNEARVTELLAQAPPESADDSRFWRFKGWVHETRGEIDEAEAAYLKALELHPYDGQVHHYLAGVYRRLTQPELVEKYQALAVLGKAIMRDSLQSSNTQALSDDLLAKMAAYAEQSDDGPVSERLRAWLAAK